jgi:hypothetical protein
MRDAANAGHFHEHTSAAGQLGVSLRFSVVVERHGFLYPFPSLSDKNRITRRWRTTASRFSLWYFHSHLAGGCASPWMFSERNALASSISLQASMHPTSELLRRGLPSHAVASHRIKASLIRSISEQGGGLNRVPSVFSGVFIDFWRDSVSHLGRSHRIQLLRQ